MSEAADPFVVAIAACEDCYWSSVWSDELGERVPTLALCKPHLRGRAR